MHIAKCIGTFWIHAGCFMGCSGVLSHLRGKAHLPQAPVLWFLAAVWNKLLPHAIMMCTCSSAVAASAMSAWSCGKGAASAAAMSLKGGGMEGQLLVTDDMGKT